MMLIISNDEGEVYARVTNVRQDAGRWVGDDDEGDTEVVSVLLEGAAIWQRQIEIARTARQMGITPDEARRITEVER